VPPSIREGSLALGATQWQTIWKQILPARCPGSPTGVILALSRRSARRAAHPRRRRGLLSCQPGARRTLLGAADQILEGVVEFNPSSSSLPAGAILVLLAILLLMNSVAIYLRNRYETKW
jgi:phosphate transport system permease protein